MEITPASLLNKTILFAAPPSCHVSIDNPREYLEMGDVVMVDEEREVAFVCFLYHGYKSTTECIPFAKIFSFHDAAATTMIELGVFRGKAHDLRGRAPFGTHPVPTE